MIPQQTLRRAFQLPEAAADWFAQAVTLTSFAVPGGLGFAAARVRAACRCIACRSPCAASCAVTGGVSVASAAALVELELDARTATAFSDAGFGSGAGVTAADALEMFMDGKNGRHDGTD